MTIAEWSGILLKASLPGIVFATGLAATRADVTWILKDIGLLLRSMLSMNVLAPLLAVTLAVTLPLDQPIRIALVALAVAPVPPLLPRKQQKKAAGQPSYAISILVTSAMLSIVVIPVTLDLLSRAIDRPLGIGASAIAGLVAKSVLIPLALGIAVQAAAPNASAAASRPIGNVSTILLVAGVLPILVDAAPAFRTLVGDGTLLVIVSFTVGALILGHWLGGPARDNRTVLALSTASRHPGIAIAIATANYPNEKHVMPAVLLFVLVGAIVTLPYVKMSRRRHDQPMPRTTTPTIRETPSRQS